MPQNSEDRPYIKYGHYVITANSRQWIVGKEYIDEESGEPYLSERTYHKDVITALKRLADRKVRNSTIDTLKQLRDEFDRVGRELLEMLDS